MVKRWVISEMAYTPYYPAATQVLYTNDGDANNAMGAVQFVSNGVDTLQKYALVAVAAIGTNSRTVTTLVKTMYTDQSAGSYSPEQMVNKTTASVTRAGPGLRAVQVAPRA